MTNRHYCCVEGCFNSKRNKKHSFFFLPKDKERRDEWLKVIGRPDLLKKTDIKPTSYQVCSVHFDKSVISEILIRKLSLEAVPTKYLPIDNTVHLQPKYIYGSTADACTQTGDDNIEHIEVKSNKRKVKIKTQQKKVKSEISKGKIKTEAENGTEVADSGANEPESTATATETVVVKVEFDCDPEVSPGTSKRRKLL